jgi:hypothetical protein
MTDRMQIRSAIQAVPFELDNTGEVPHPGTLHIPPAHRKALAREAVLVVGARGVGKSFWTTALNDDALREKIGAIVPELRSTKIHIGHAAQSNIQAYPDRDTFKRLLDCGHRPYDVWRAVIVRWLAEVTGRQIPSGDWSETAEWANSNPEQLAGIVEAANQKLTETNQFGMILFDALDRTSRDWQTMNRIVRELLEVALWLRDFSRIRAKIFLRPDQMERTNTSFVDASKILATRAELTWDIADLHAMLWQRFINAPDEHGGCLRSIVNGVLPASDQLTDLEGDWRLPARLTTESQDQRRLFEAVAGDKMGKDARRGVPYVWSVSHLADGHGWASPRSFLAAILGAAEDSAKRYTDYPLALHYESLKRGIQNASKIRVDQVAEDDPWVPLVMESLRGKSVPCDFQIISDVWELAFPDGPGTISSALLPPQHGESWNGIRKDLERLGIFITRKDGRVDLPDIYRVGFGLGRKGGVKPSKI